MKIYRLIGAMLIAAALTACGNKQKAATEDQSHDENLQLIAYSEAFELYGEATPFVVGQQSSILAHFTLLENFKPIAEAKITANLIIGTDGVRQTLDKPTRPGIYLFNITPTSAGEGQVVFDIETEQGKSQITVANITVYTDIDQAQHAAAAAVVSSSNGALFTKEASWKSDFATQEARFESFGQVIRATAQILPSQGDQRVVAAKAGGIVTFSGQQIVEGAAVGAGAELFSINSEGMADNNLSVRLSEATAEYNRAKVEYQRKAELAKENIVSQSELLRAQTEFSNAEVVYNNLRKNFSSGRQSVSSPIGGFVTQILVRNGEYVEAGAPVMVVAQNRNLLIKAELQPKYYSLLSGIKTANFAITNSNLRYTLEELDGKVVSYGKSSNLENPLIPVVFEVKNSVGLLSGSFVEVFIKTETSAQAVTIPNEAIIEEMGNYFVYTQLTPEYFEKRAIRKGVTDGFCTQILEGVSVGDRVVSRGAILVKLVQASGTLDSHSGHVH